MEEQRNNPLPLLICSGLLGYLLGNVWIGLAVGFALTIIPFVSMVGLVLNNLILRVVGFVLLAIGFPFFLIGRKVRSVVGRKES
jgi:hypothetical protein